MAFTGVDIIGIKRLEATLKQLDRDALNLARRTVVATARDVRDLAREKVPRGGGGTLRRAIIHRRERGRPGFAEASVRITHGRGQKHDAYYWHMVEFGTVHSEARPYLLPTLKVFGLRMPKIFRDRFGRPLERRMRLAAQLGVQTT